MYKKFILGCAQFGHPYGILNKKKKKPSNTQIKKILNFLLKKKILRLDTAMVYNFDFKKFIKEKNSIINTKIKNKFDKINNCNCLFLHDGDNLFKKKNITIYKKMLLLKKKNRIKKIGISLYNFKNINKILRNFKFDAIQVPYNVFDRRLEKYLSVLKKKGIEIHVRSVFLQGLLLEDFNKLNPYFKKWIKLFNFYENQTKLKKIDKLMYCLNFVLQNKKIDKIIIGVQSLNEIKKIFDLKIIRGKSLRYNNLISSDDENLINPSKWKLTKKI